MPRSSFGCRTNCESVIDAAPVLTRKIAESPTISIPGCRNVTPLSTVTVPSVSWYVALFAINDWLPRSHFHGSTQVATILHPVLELLRFGVQRQGLEFAFLQRRKHRLDIRAVAILGKHAQTRCG